MKLLLNEMYKLSHSKVFLFVFVLAALLNIYISFTSEISGNKFSDESYKNLYVETYEMDYDEAKSFLQNKTILDSANQGVPFMCSTVSFVAATLSSVRPE